MAEREGQSTSSSNSFSGLSDCLVSTCSGIENCSFEAFNKTIEFIKGDEIIDDDVEDLLKTLNVFYEDHCKKIKNFSV